MAKLSEKSAGSIVTIKENGSVTNFLVLIHGYPASGRTLLLREDLYGNLQWNTSDVATYSGSYIDNWLNSIYLNLIDEKIRDLIAEVSIQYGVAGGNSTISSMNRKVFLLSGKELGSDDFRFQLELGETIPYFDSQSKRIAYLSGVPSVWWLRSVSSRVDDSAYIVTINGIIGSLESCSSSQGVRPAFTLPSDVDVSDSGEIVVNEPPTTPSSISFGTPYAGKALSVSCGASTDPDGDSITYVFERQVDSKAWMQVGATTSRSISTTCPNSGTTVNYRVKARDINGAESGYRTGTAKAIIYNQPPTAPGTPQYKYPIPSETMKAIWQASTDPEGAAITYVVETKTGDGNWTQAGETSDTSYQLTVPQVSAVGTMLTVRVKAKDPDGAESAYSTGEAAEILYHKVIRKIPWPQGTPFKSRQFTYNSKKQFQTMMCGALAGIEISDVFQNNTWENICYAAENNMIPDAWKEGDTKDLTLTTGETVTLAIVGFDHDDKADGSGKAKITLGMKNLMADTYAMNATTTNSGSFVGSDMYKHLSETVFQTIPKELQDHIVEVNKLTSSGGGSSSIRTDPLKIWLLSEVEVFGERFESFPGEGTQYEYYKTTDNRIKRMSNGDESTNSWCERSPKQNATAFCGVGDGGKAQNGISATTMRGVCWNVCIG